MQLNQSAAEKLIAELGMKDMPIKMLHPTPTAVSPDWFTKYKELCKQFMLSLTDSVETLAFMNLPQQEFMNLIMGHSVPENMSFRLRVPLVMGGKLEIDNMFMCRTFPHAYNMDRFIMAQSGASTIWLPDPPTKVYHPAQTLGGGDGGNGTEDRLTETIASQIVGDRDF